LGAIFPLHHVTVNVVVAGMAVLVAVASTGPSGTVATEGVTLLLVTVIGTPQASLTWLIQNHRHTWRQTGLISSLVIPPNIQLLVVTASTVFFILDLSVEHIM